MLRAALGRLLSAKHMSGWSFGRHEEMVMTGPKRWCRLAQDRRRVSLQPALAATQEVLHAGPGPGSAPCLRRREAQQASWLAETLAGEDGETGGAV